MSTKTKPAQSEMLQFFHVNEGVRKNLARRFLEFQEKKRRQTQERNATLRQMSKYLSEVQGEARPASRDPKTAKALKGLLGVHEKLAKHKLAPPKAMLGIGGLSYSVTVTPPYQEHKTIPSADQEGFPPILTGFADPNTGQLSASAITASDEPGFSGGDTYSYVGILFTSTVPGTLTVYVNPIYSYEWWTESFFPSHAVSSILTGSLQVYGYLAPPNQPIIEVSASQAFFHSSEQKPGPLPLILEDGFNVQASASVSVPVDPALVYLIFVSADTGVSGALGAIAGAMLSVTVPSITYNFEMQPTVVNG
jgi:hypothetical protein